MNRTEDAMIGKDPSRVMTVQRGDPVSWTVYSDEPKTVWIDGIARAVTMPTWQLLQDAPDSPAAYDMIKALARRPPASETGTVYEDEEIIGIADPALDDVNHPAHYGGADHPYEPIKIIAAQGWLDGFCKGNALKYVLRAGQKPGEPAAKDLRKAAWYLEYLADHLSFRGSDE